jgi:hypothetical protein
MLSLKINGTPVDLPSDFSFTMNLKSPLFGDTGSYSYPFRIPATPRNKIILKFPHREAGTNDPFIYLPAVFEWNGITLFSGNARLKAVNSNYYEGAVFDANGNFYFELRNRKLNSVDMGGMSFADEAAAIEYFSNTPRGYYPTYPITFPLFNNPEYFDPPTELEELKFYNYQYHNNPAFFQLLTTNGLERTVMIPMLYLKYVINKLFENLGYSLNDQMFSTHADFNRLVLFNQTNCNNAGNNVPVRVPLDYRVTELVFNYHVPRVLINDFLTGLQQYFGFGMFVNSVSQTVKFIPLKNIILATDYVEFSKNITSVGKEYEARPGGYLLTMAIEDDYLKEIRDIDERTMQLFGGSVPSYVDLPVYPFAAIGAIYFVEDTGIYYKLLPTKIWQSTSGVYLLTERMFGNGNEKIETSFSIVKGVTGAMVAPVSGLMNDFTEIIPRVFFAANDMNGYGTNARVTTDDNSLYYFTVGMTSQIGMLKYWTDWLKFKSAANLVKFQKLIEFTDLHDFDFSKKYMINGRKYLVKSIQVTLKKDRIMIATLECYTCD